MSLGSLAPSLPAAHDTGDGAVRDVILAAPMETPGPSIQGAFHLNSRKKSAAVPIRLSHGPA
jgi:hypothetical protein